MSFEGERSHQYRILRALKNRFGGTDEIGVFAMAAKGWRKSPTRRCLFLSGREDAASGQRGVPGAGRHAAGAVSRSRR
jgi:DNA repair protein RadA/Sms